MHHATLFENGIKNVSSVLHFNSENSLKGKKNWLDDVYENALQDYFLQFSSTAHPLILKLLKLTRGS